MSELTQTKFDVLVIGGGINGAAIANVACCAGASVCLLEKNDWASGTSSKSTKLLHGGIRYLENFEFDLVAESLKERFIQFKSIPHLVKPIRFIIPVYQGLGRPMWKMHLGVWLYDLLSGEYALGRHQSLSREDVIRFSPGINQSGLIGGVAYFDAQMDDARIVLENVLMARQRGAQTLNYVAVQEFIHDNGKAVGVRVQDSFSKTVFEIKAEHIIVAAGPWSDALKRSDTPSGNARLRTTKGVHVLCEGNIGENAFLLQNPKDNRVFFMIPFNGQALIGTTDTDYIGNPDEVRADEDDIDYLLNQAGQYFPGLQLSKSHIITTFAGLRPLVHERGAPSKVSRKHVIERNASGVYYVMGGKYTTYRAIANETVAAVLPKQYRLIPKSETYELFGSGMEEEDINALSQEYNLERSVISHLMGIYGRRFKDVLALVLKDTGLKSPLCACSLTIRAQVVYAMDVEMAVTAQDIFERRLNLQYNKCPSRKCLKTIAEMVSLHKFKNR